MTNESDRLIVLGVLSLFLIAATAVPVLAAQPRLAGGEITPDGVIAWVELPLTGCVPNEKYCISWGTADERIEFFVCIPQATVTKNRIVKIKTTSRGDIYLCREVEKGVSGERHLIKIEGKVIR